MPSPSNPSGDDQQSGNDPSASLTDYSSLPSLWSGLSPLPSVSDVGEWRDMLDKLVTNENPTPQQHQQTASFDCFSTALKVIEQLHGCQQNLEVWTVDYILNVTCDATKSCEVFCNCMQQRQCGQLLLYIAILQQVAICYAFLIESPFSLSSQNIQLRVGNFEVQMDMTPEMGRVVLSAEVERAAKVASEMSNVLQTRVTENPSDEMRYQLNLINTLYNDLKRSLDKVKAKSYSDAGQS